MVQTLFEADQPLAMNTMVTYNLQPSQQLVSIRSVLASRKRKSNILSPSSSCVSIASNKHVYDDMYSGLPSPPVESSLDDFSTMSAKPKSTHSPPLTPNTTFSSCSSVTTVTNNNNNNNKSCLLEETKSGSLSTKDIKSKLEALREEKHSMFQLLKRLVEDEEHQQQQQRQQQQQQRQQKYQVEKEEQHRHQLVVGIQSMDHHQQQQQPNLKKKKTSRWSSPLSQHQVQNSNYTINTKISRHTTALASPHHTHTVPQMNLGGPQQPTLTRPQQPPYFY